RWGAPVSRGSPAPAAARRTLSPGGHRDTPRRVYSRPAMADELPKSQIAAAAASGRAAHPDLAIDETAFSDYIAERLDPDASGGGPAELAVGDLAVAFAATRGDAAAV